MKSELLAFPKMLALTAFIAGYFFQSISATGDPVAIPRPEDDPVAIRRPDHTATDGNPGSVSPLDRLFSYPGFAEKAGKRIWKSECNGTKSGLTSWNDGEEFASLGIGHFLWYPAGKEFEFEESFPHLLDFYRQNESRLPSQIPEWLLDTPDCPWRTKAEFDKAVSDPRMVELRDFLYTTVSLQTEFIYQRLKESRAKLLGLTDEDRKEEVGKVFDILLKSPSGFFAMLDYVNFKGEGTNPKERYNGDGWGLLQVLERMRNDVTVESAHKDFARAATRTLENRVENNPRDKRWLKGWSNRTAAYAKDF